MGKQKGEQDVRESQRINEELLRSYSLAGKNALGPTLRYIRGEIDRGDIPDYANQAYEGVAGAAGEAAIREEMAARGGIDLNAGGGAALRQLAALGASGGRSYATERGAIRSSQALTRVDQRNKLFQLLSGSGAQSTDLAQGFGRLGSAAAGLASQGGNPTYEATIGLLGAGTQAYLNSQIASQSRINSAQALAGTPSYVMPASSTALLPLLTTSNNLGNVMGRP